MSEKLLQAVLMRRAMTELGHQIALPNDTSFYDWEADLLTVNKSGYVNEYECKISKADFLRDKCKYKFKRFDEKESVLDANTLPESLKAFYTKSQKTPNYFWYATLDFDIECPDFAGWLKVSYVEKRARHEVTVMKQAPLRHKVKPNERVIKIAARLLSFKLMDMYSVYAKRSVPQ